MFKTWMITKVRNTHTSEFRMKNLKGCFLVTEYTLGFMISNVGGVHFSFYKSTKNQLQM